MEQQLTKSSEADLAGRVILIKHAKELGLLIAKNAGATDRDRRVVEENIQALTKAGIFRTAVPRRYGGYESSLRTHLELSSTIGEYCGGTAWVVALTNVCAWFTSLFAERAQNDVFGANADARVAGVFTPATDVRRREGGLVVTGKWYWSSGCLHADWGILGVLEADSAGKMINQYLALIPMSELSIEDTWYTAGMRGSGSNCVVAKDVFVPDHRLLSILDAIGGNYRTEHKDEAAYRAAFVPFAALILAGPLLGMGRAALKFVIEKAPQRAIQYTFFQKQTDSVAFHLQIAEAAMKVDTAHLHAFRAAEDVDHAAQQGFYPEYLIRARVRADTAYSNEHIIDALNILMTAHGAGSFAESSPMQRMWRDSNTAARHAVALQTVSDEVYGKALLGVENTVTPLV
jgi:3-hydroxy-9,10-secoandrosta-1,3,5(10)-triene-9,17-dione monooxygenase